CAATQPYTLALHDALPILVPSECEINCTPLMEFFQIGYVRFDHVSTFDADHCCNFSFGIDSIDIRSLCRQLHSIRILLKNLFERSEEHTSELQSRENPVCR